MLTQKELRELHGKKYVESFRKIQSTFRLERLIEEFQLSSSDKVADFGCGNGMMLPLVVNKVSKYIGVDFSKEFIEDAIKINASLSVGKAEFVCEDILDFCIKRENTFDIAFAMDFSEHVYDKEWIAILNSIKRSLKRGGKLYIHTPNSDFFLEKMKRKNILVKQLPEHIAVRNVEQNCDLLMEAGFKISKIKLIPHYNWLRCVHFLSFIPVFGKFFRARIFIEAIA